MSLIEIMIVIVLIGLIGSAVAVPVMNRLDKGRYENTKKPNS